MKNKIFAHWGFAFLLFIILVFNFRALSGDFLPAPMNEMIGLYHPFRDLYASEYPNGVPYKNFLLTDPFRQLIVWKDLSIDILKNGSLPLWNPYEMAGKPLAGNFQSGVFYPVNFLFFVFPFKAAWAIYIISSQIIGGLCMYFYLGYLKKSETLKTLGSIAFVFSGFFIAWYEWGNVGHAFAWFPLALLVCERISNKKNNLVKHSILNGIQLGIIFSLSFLAGHPQTTLYSIIFSLAYLLFVVYARLLHKGIALLASFFTFFLMCLIQLYQGIQFIGSSLRGEDQVYSSIEGWFVPYQNLIQFLIPDFFGNPSTLNYWGVFNYAEFVGYVGIPFVLLALLSFRARKDKIFYFCLGLILICLIFVTSNIISHLPYKLSIPVISSMQPTRLMGFLSFGVLMLGVIGFETLQKKISLKKGLMLLLLPSVLFGLLWTSVYMNPFGIDTVNLAVSKRNLIFPTLVAVVSILLLSAIQVLAEKKRYKAFSGVLIFLFLSVFVFDLMRFANKFTPFSSKDYFFPTTSVVEFLQKNAGSHRVLSIDDKILAPNITTYYKIQNLAGYDPLYLKNFAELIVASERGSSEISYPYGFNRIISPKNIDSEIIDLLGVKYVLSIGDITSEKFELVAQEGITKVYENKRVYDRAFFVEEIKTSSDSSERLELMLNSDLTKTAVVGEATDLGSKRNFAMGIVRSYTLRDNGVRVEVETSEEGFLVTSDSYYSLVKAYIDGVETKVYEVDHALRGVIVPQGSRVVEFKTALVK